MVVFTKFDKLLESKRLELRDETEENGPLVGEGLNSQSEVEAKKVLALCVKSVSGAMTRLQIPMPPHVDVSSIISHSLFDQRHG